MKESYLYAKLESKKVQCHTCAHNCFILPENYGVCGVRKNIDGKLYALNYGKLVSESIDPVEKKPFFHFLPGTYSLSIATVGCNLRCGNCQNWQISQTVKTDKSLLDMGENIMPEEIVKDAIKNKCPSISYTYTEPTIFLEYALDTMKIAKKNNIKNAWVSNGFMSPEMLKIIAPYLNAANVDLKSFDPEFYKSNCGARLEPILDNLKQMKKLGIWVEVTTLIIPSLSDDKEMLTKAAEFIFKELGSETPWHVTAFSGEISWKLRNLPDTPAKKIRQAYEIGKKTGLKYVYAGNVPEENLENTYCSRCRKLAIERAGYAVERIDKNGKCADCGEDLNIII